MYLPISITTSHCELVKLHKQQGWITTKYDTNILFGECTQISCSKNRKKSDENTPEYHIFFYFTGDDPQYDTSQCMWLQAEY